MKQKFNATRYQSKCCDVFETDIGWAAYVSLNEVDASKFIGNFIGPNTAMEACNEYIKRAPAQMTFKFSTQD